MSEYVVVFVEVASGSRNKYELDEDLGVIVLDRRLFTSMAYPAAYGFIEGTLGGGGDPLPRPPGGRREADVPGLSHPWPRRRRVPHGRREGAGREDPLRSPE